MSNNLDLDQDRRFVEHDLGQTVGKGYQQRTNSLLVGKEFIQTNFFFKIEIHNKIS